MSRRRRRVKIKSSSRLFAFILFNLLLLASCITAHYQPRPQSDKLEGHTLQVAALSGPPESPPTTQSTQNSQNQNNQLKPKQDQIQMLSNIAPAQTSHQPLAIQSHFIDESSEVERVTNHQLQQQQHQPPNRDTGGHHLTAATTLPSIASLCSALPVANARQLRLCRLVSHSPNANEAVALGAARGLAECRQQFRSERWNCTHAAGDHHLLTSKLAQSVGNRESGFVQAIAAAGIVHSIATACSTGSLNDCACDKSRVGPIRQRDQNWKWGGCSNNIRHGMMYARHLVELLDAVHEHHHHHMQRSLGNHRQHGHQQSLAARCQQLRRRRSLQTSPANSRQQDQQQQQQANFCQRNQNISQTIHIQLIKSLLAKNSLERHQDFRLAMNAHNNRVGRMAVAKNMEIKCRCHGLSGSCSLKTCWLKLPDFQQIGAYLKRKYEGSIHLPTAINVNKLIPMMDRNELSAILLQQQQAAVGAPSASEPSLPESANSLRVAVLSTEQSQPEFAALSGEAAGSAPPTQPARLNFYERHKQQPEQRPSKPLANSHQPNATSTTTSLFLHGDEVPVHIAPMSQQQYQTLLREMRLCNSSQIATRASRLTVRDLQNHSTDAGSLLLASQCYQLQQQQQQQYSAGNRKLAAGVNSLSPSGHNEIGGRPNQGSAGQRPLAMSQAQLGHLLQGNNREELVHLHKSPDYCEPDLKHGFAGVQARLCSNDPQAPDSCDRLCCGRGFERREIELRYNCDCKFQYCCKIHCNVCQKTLVEYVCK